MQHEVNCQECKQPVTVMVEDSNEEAFEGMGFGMSHWLKRIVCDDCDFHRRTGYRKPDKPLFDL